MVSESPARPDSVTGRYLFLHKALLKSAGIDAGSDGSRCVSSLLGCRLLFVRFFFLIDGRLHHGFPVLQISKLLVHLSNKS